MQIPLTIRQRSDPSPPTSSVSKSELPLPEINMGPQHNAKIKWIKMKNERLQEHFQHLKGGVAQMVER